MPNLRKIEKVLLVFPPVIFSQESLKQIMPPLGISYLAAYLKDDYEVRLLDAALEGYEEERAVAPGFYRYGLGEEAIEEKIRAFSPDVVGVSCLYSSQIQQVLSVCRTAKNVSSKIITVIGGTHPTFLPGQCLQDKNLDYIVLGEGEKSLKELLDNIRDGISIARIDGIAFRHNGAVRINPKQRYIEDVDSLPFPARELLPLEKYFRIGLPMGLLMKRSPAINLITSRGCPFDCAFCSSCRFWGSRYRPRSVENVLEEMESLRGMGIKELKFFDDNLTLDTSRAKRLFQGMIERKFGFSWNTPNGIAAHTLDEEMLSLMKESGCYELTLAVETGDEQTARTVLKKPADLKQTLRTADLVKRYGIDTYGFFIIGFPQETKQQIFNTLRFMDEIKLDRVSLLIANPLPGTELYEYCRDKGYLKEGGEFSQLDYFHSVFETPEFDSEFLERLRRRWYWKYNIKLLLRNPFKFFRKYSIFIFKRPILLARIFFQKLIIPSLKNAKHRAN